MWLLGGREEYATNDILDDMWKFNLSTQQWQEVRGCRHPTVSAVPHAVHAGHWWIVDTSVKPVIVRCFNFASQRWAYEPPSCASVSELLADKPVSEYSVKGLKEAILARGGSVADCFEKDELQARLKSLQESGQMASSPAAGVAASTTTLASSSSRLKGSGGSAPVGTGGLCLGEVIVGGPKPHFASLDGVGWLQKGVLYVWAREDNNYLDSIHESDRLMLWGLHLDHGVQPRWVPEIVVARESEYTPAKKYGGMICPIYGEAAAVVDSETGKAYVFGGWNDDYNW